MFIGPSSRFHIPPTLDDSILPPRKRLRSEETEDAPSPVLSTSPLTSTELIPGKRTFREFTETSSEDMLDAALQPGPDNHHTMGQLDELEFPCLPPRLKAQIKELITKAIIENCTSFSFHTEFGLLKGRITDSGLQMDIRKEYASTATIEYFSLLHVKQGKGLELYVKPTPGENSEVLERAVSASSYFHKRGIPNIAVMRPVSHRKDPSRFKGALMDFCNVGTATVFKDEPKGTEDLWVRICIARQAAIALQQIHKDGVAHLSPTPENILVHFETEWNINSFLTGCGYSSPFGSRIIIPNRIKLLFPPEVIYHEEIESSPWIDSWIFGLTLYDLFHGACSNPFRNQLTEDIFSFSPDMITATVETLRRQLLMTLNPHHPIDKLIIESLRDLSLRISIEDLVQRLLEISP